MPIIFKVPKCYYFESHCLHSLGNTIKSLQMIDVALVQLKPSKFKLKTPSYVSPVSKQLG